MCRSGVFAYEELQRRYHTDLAKKFKKIGETVNKTMKAGRIKRKIRVKQEKKVKERERGGQGKD